MEAEVAFGSSLEAADTQGIHYIRPPTNHRPLVDGRKHLHHVAVIPRRVVALLHFVAGSDQEIVKHH